MGELHNLHILNYIPCFLDTSKFTCFPHFFGGGSASVVDYVLSSRALVPHIQDFLVSCQLPLTLPLLLLILPRCTSMVFTPLTTLSSFLTLCQSSTLSRSLPALLFMTSYLMPFERLPLTPYPKEFVIPLPAIRMVLAL